MKPIDFTNHCREVGGWVDWEDTTDVVLHGDPSAEATGIAVTWLATDAVIRHAAELNCNFLIVHEGLFYPAFTSYASEQGHHEAKRQLLDELGITVFRCHDTWDRMPEVGICDTWAEFLGLVGEPRQADGYYKVCPINEMTGEDVAQAVLEKIGPLGQTYVHVMGDLSKRVSRVAVGTGAITRLPEMHELGADIIVASDDGIHTTNCGLWSCDLDIPVITVCHSTSELPGMMALADYVKTLYPAHLVTYLPCGFPDCRISAST